MKDLIVTEYGPVRVTVAPTNVLRRWPCTACGDYTEKEDWLAEFSDKGWGGIICEGCLAAGPAVVRERLVEHADRLMADAHKLRSLAVRAWVLPTEEEWKTFQETWKAENGEAWETEYGDAGPPPYPGSEERKESREDARHPDDRPF